MTRSKVAVLSVLVALLLAISLASCDQGTKKITIRYKSLPGMNLAYQQITRGIQEVVDRKTGKVISKEYLVTTLDLTTSVRRVLEDSTAENLVTRKWQQRYIDLQKKNSADTVTKQPMAEEPMIEYSKPNGRLVDIAYASDTSEGDLSYLKEYTRQGWPVFPDGEVGQGYSWTQTTTVVLPEGPVEASTTYTVKSFARERGYDCVVIEYDGVCIVPLPPRTGKEHKLLSGVDRITSKGHMYFAYKEGFLVSLKERWLLESDRTINRLVADTVHGYEAGDTIPMHVGLEYDVDYYLTNITTP
jgi:hypothetical protein